MVTFLDDIKRNLEKAGIAKDIRNEYEVRERLVGVGNKLIESGGMICEVQNSSQTWYSLILLRVV